MHRILKIAAFLSVMFGTSVQAENDLFVIELYTSQGCSSCPPADAMLTRYAERDDVIALAFHVDYWDYLGWTDTMGQAAFSRRQRYYAAAAGHSMVYTPQMIINGEHHIKGYRPEELLGHYEENYRAPVPVRIRRLGNDQVQITADPAPHIGQMSVQLIRFIPETRVQVRRGENAGREILYTNSVTNLRVLRRWTGSSPLNLTVEAPGPDGLAVLIQATGHGPIYGAALLR